MEIRTLRYFLTIAREENMTKAADILHVSQPTLSKQMKALEEELGKKLFTRHSFSIRLTDEGMLLRSRAEDLVSMADRIEQEFVSLDDITGGDLYLGLAESYQIRLLAREIRKMKQLYPHLHYHITSGDTEQVIDKLDKGLLDFVVLAETPDPARYASIQFPHPDVWGVIMPVDDPLAQKSEVTIDDLAGLPLFASGQGWRNEIAAWAGQRAPELHLEGEFRLSYNASLFTKERLGYLLTFDKLIDTSPESGLAYRPLSPRLECPLYLTWSRFQNFSPIAERFLRQIKSAFDA